MRSSLLSWCQWGFDSWNQIRYFRPIPICSLPPLVKTPAPTFEIPVNHNLIMIYLHEPLLRFTQTSCGGSLSCIYTTDYSFIPQISGRSKDLCDHGFWSKGVSTSKGTLASVKLIAICLIHATGQRNRGWSSIVAEREERDYQCCWNCMSLNTFDDEVVSLSSYQTLTAINIWQGRPQAAGGIISASILSTPGASKIYKGGLTVSLSPAPFYGYWCAVALHSGISHSFWFVLSNSLVNNSLMYTQRAGIKTISKHIRVPRLILLLD